MEKDRKQLSQKIDDIFIFTPPLGKGNFGSVFLAEHEKTRQRCVCKTISLKALLTEEDKQRTFREITNSFYLNHPNINKLLFIKRTKANLFLFFRLCTGGELGKLQQAYVVKYGKPFPDQVIAFFAKQIIIGLYYLTELGIAHRDIKLANLLVTENKEMPFSYKSNVEDWSSFDEIMDSLPISSHKNISNEVEISYIPFDPLESIEENLSDIRIEIADFGFSKFINRPKMQTFLGTPTTIAPEVLLKQNYDATCDVWSLGCVLFKLKTGTHPFPGKNIQDLYKRIEAGNLELPKGTYSINFLGLIEKMLDFDPQRRISLPDCACHDFFFDSEEKIEVLEKKQICLRFEKLKVIEEFSDSYDLKIELSDSEVEVDGSKYVLITLKYT